MGTYSFQVEFDADVQEAFVIRGTLRAYRGTDTQFTVFVRTEDGPMNLASVGTLEAVVVDGEVPLCWDWGLTLASSELPVLTVPAYSPEPGRVMFTLSGGNLRTRLFGPSHTLFIRADGRTIYSASLEVVG